MKRMFLAISLLAAPTFVHALPASPDATSAAQGPTEEVTYDDLVNELSARRHKARKPTEASPFDQVQVHAGLGLVNSFSQFSLAGHDVSRTESGMQLAVGVDLFSPQWQAEIAWRNFGLTTNGSEEHSLRELDFKFAYRDALDKTWDYRAQGGLAQRTLRLTDASKGLDVNDTTPALLASIGAIARVTPQASFAADAGARAPVVGRTSDKGSLDLSLEFNLSL